MSAHRDGGRGDRIVPSIGPRLRHIVLGMPFPRFVFLFRHAGLGFFQKPDDLVFRKALFHARLLLRKRTLLGSDWLGLLGAGHTLRAPCG